MKRFIFVLCIVLLLVIACRPTETAAPPGPVVPTEEPPTATSAATDTFRPTATTQPTDTSTPLSTATATIKPTATLRPTRTPAPRSTRVELQLDTIEEIVAESGFAFRPYTSFIHMERQGGLAFFGDEAGVFLATLGGGKTESGRTLDLVLIDLAQLLNESMTTANFRFGDPYPMIVDSVEGLATDISGSLFNDPVLGQLVVAHPFEGQVFYAYALGNTTAGDFVWVEEGSMRFDELLSTVRFFPIEAVETSATQATPPTATGNSPCPISVDASYGFTKENAIRVGGDSFGGPSRARAYLETLLGPAGQTVTHQRVGSEPFGNTILDAYEVSYEGAPQPAILYVDQYAFETLYAPVGFTCKIAFPLNAP